MSSDPQGAHPNTTHSTRQLLKEVKNASVGSFAEGLKQGWSGTKTDWSYESSAVPKDVLAPCPACNATISTVAESCPHCGHPMSEALWKTAQVARDRKTQRRTSYVVWGVLLFVGFVVYNGMTYKPQRSSLDGSSTCDRLAKQNVKNPSSYQSSSKIDAKEVGNLNVIRRNFTAMNGFGGIIDHWYLCEFDTTTKMARLIEINQGNYR